MEKYILIYLNEHNEIVIKDDLNSEELITIVRKNDFHYPDYAIIKGGKQIKDFYNPIKLDALE